MGTTEDCTEVPLNVALRGHHIRAVDLGSQVAAPVPSAERTETDTTAEGMHARRGRTCAHTPRGMATQTAATAKGYSRKQRPARNEVLRGPKANNQPMDNGAVKIVASRVSAAIRNCSSLDV